MKSAFLITAFLNFSLAWGSTCESLLGSPTGSLLGSPAQSIERSHIEALALEFVNLQKSVGTEGHQTRLERLNQALKIVAANEEAKNLFQKKVGELRDQKISPEKSSSQQSQRRRSQWRTYLPTHSFAMDSLVHSLSLSSQGKLAFPVGGSLRIVNLETGALEGTFRQHDLDLILHAEFSADGNSVATYLMGSIIRQVDVKTGMAELLVPHTVDVFNTAGFIHFNKSQTRVISTVIANGANVIDLATKTVLTESVHKAQVLTAQLSPQENWLITTGEDSFVHMVDINNYDNVKKFQFNEPLRFAMMNEREDSILVAHGNDVTLIDVASGNRAKPLPSASSPVVYAQFANGDTEVVIGSQDGTIRIYNLSGKVKSELKVPGQLSNFRISSDQKWIVTLTQDKLVQVWKLDLE